MGSTEQRRYTRLSTKQPARIRAAGTVLLGEIRDYCQAGLYLAFERPLEDDVLRHLAPAVAVEVEFDAAAGLPPAVHRVHARVARSLATGLALQVAALPHGVVDALQAAAAAKQAPAAPTGRAVDAAARQAMQQECNRLFGTFLKEVLDELFRKLPGQLNEAADLAVGTTQRLRFGQAGAEFARQRTKVTDHIVGAIRDALRQPGQAARPEREKVSSAELALVDDEQFEDWLSLSTVAHQVESELTLPLADLHRRYGALRGLELDRTSNPFGPQVICRAFQDAIHAHVDQPVAVHAVAYKAFGQPLGRHLPRLYEQLNRVLAPLDEPPAPRGLRRSVEASAAEGRGDGGAHGVGAHRGTSGAGGESKKDASHHGGAAEPSTPPPAVDRDDLAKLVESVQSLQRQMQAGGSGGSVDYNFDRLMASLARARAADGAAAATGEEAAGVSARPAAFAAPESSGIALLRTIERLLQSGAGSAAGMSPSTSPSTSPDMSPAPRVGVSAAGVSSVGPPGVEPAGASAQRGIARAPPATGVIVGSGLFAAPQAGGSAGAAIDPRAWQALIDSLPGGAEARPDGAASAGQGIAPVGPSLSARLVAALPGLSLPEPQRLTLGNATGLVARALTETDVDSEIQSLLRQLERPLLALALRDPTLVDSPEHPARRMVDVLEQYAIATDDKGRFQDPALRNFLQQVVERVVRDADQDPTVFERAHAPLARLLEPIRETRRLRVASLQEVCEARERMRQARRRVNDALAQRLGGRQVPGLVLRLLAVGWRQRMILAAMRGGPEGDDWQQALAAIDQLMDWLAPGDAGKRDWSAQAAGLVGRIETALSAVAIDAPQLADFVARLEQTLRAVAAGSEPPPAAPYPLPAATDADALPDGEAAAWSRRLRLGDWWLVPHEGRTRPMQLVWTSRPAGQCAFTSRSAGERQELSLAELARQVADGRIRPCADQDRPLLERSTFSLLDEGRQLLQQRAQRDAVSGLPNRKGLLERLRQEHTRGADGARRVLAVLEFDQVRMIGNACGGDVAERLTRELAQATQRCAGEQAVVASLRDDTLAVLLPAGDAGDDAANAVAHAVVARLGDHRFEHGEQRYSIGVNVGLAVYEPATVAPEEAIRRADAACAAAKAQGRNQAQVYEPDSVHLKSHESLAEWAGRIDRLLEGEGLFLRAQMVMPIGTDASLQPYYEVLLGIETEPGVSAEPMSFVPAVERLKRSYELDLWVMRQVLKWIEDNRRVFDTIGGFAINVSPLSLGNAEIVAFLHERLSRAGVSAGKLRFEITETAAIEGYGVAQEFIRQFRRYGCRFSLDDFGSGYTSYSHLKNLQTDTLKIDGSFVKDMVASDSDRAMVKSMHDVARSLGMRTVAEYVETPMILARLREIGVDYAQGYAIHKPCPISELAGF